jgi:hypothetical protein
MIGISGTFVRAQRDFQDFGQFGAAPKTHSMIHLISKEEIVLIPPRVDSVWVVSQFKKHELKWKRDTQYVSSLSDKFLHDSYARIIGMGWPAVHLVLRSLAQDPDDWFYALRAMTGVDPVKASDVGNITNMTRAWLNWGKKRKLI